MDNFCKQALVPREPTPYALKLKASAADNYISIISFIAFLISWELICRLGIQLGELACKDCLPFRAWIVVRVAALRAGCCFC